MIKGNRASHKKAMLTLITFVTIIYAFCFGVVNFPGFIGYLVGGAVILACLAAVYTIAYRHFEGDL